MANTQPPPYKEPALPGSPVVYGNVLDMFDNFTYNARLYMIPENASPPASGTPDTTSGDERETSSAGSNSGGGGFARGFMSALPADTIVLAQTGVTGTQIDNIDVSIFPGPGNTIIPTSVNFDIIQPGAADFLDQVIAARSALGLPTSSNDAPIFLEIVFKGYTSEVDPDGAGIPTNIAGPFRYKLTISTVELAINAEGSTYSFGCAPLPYSGYADEVYTVPKLISTTGSSIEEHIAAFTNIINENTAKTDNSYQIPDVIEFDLSGLKRETNAFGLADLTITTNDMDRSEEVNRNNNPALEGLSQEEYNEAVREIDKDEGTVDILVTSDGIKAREGITISRYLETLLSMSDEFYSRLTRKVNPKDPENLEIDKSRPFVNWYRLHTYVELIGFDNKRNAYAKKVVYKPIIYGSGKTIIQIQPDENDLNKEETVARIKPLDIKKSYHYLFTGQNDQIINCDISYKAGVAILLAPNGGMSGDASTTLGPTFNSTAAPTDDLSNTDLTTAALKGTTLDKIKSLLGTAQEGEIARLASSAGFSVSEASAAINNAASQARATLANILSDRRLAAAVIEDSTASRRNTSSDNLSNTDGTTYSPTPSGYTYSADLLGGTGVTDRLNSDVALKDARTITANDLNESAVAPTPAKISKNIPSTVEDATYDGTPRNTLFGYISQQHNATAFLVKLDMQIRGDPWYLGESNTNNLDPLKQQGSEYLAESTGTGVNLKGNDVFVYFDMQASRRFDQDVLDEDNNTGYWKPSGTAYFISGIYRVIAVVNRFSEGEFSQELQLIKEPGFQPDKISDASAEPVEEQSANTRPQYSNRAIFEIDHAEWYQSGGGLDTEPIFVGITDSPRNTLRRQLPN